MSIKHTSQLSFVAAIQQHEMDTIASDAATLKLECQVMILCCVVSRQDCTILFNISLGY